MDEDIERGLAEIVKGRLTKSKTQINHSLKQIAAGNPLGSETKAERRVSRIANKTGLSFQDSEALSDMIVRAARQIDSKGGAKGGPEARQGPTIDFVGVEFLSRGRLAANAVGRVVFRSGRAEGTGFLVGPGLFLTNNHVIGTPEKAEQMLVEFDFEADEAGADRPTTTFAFDFNQCFVFDPIKQLDFTLIAIGERIRGTKAIGSFGYIPLSDASDKHMLGEIANIIQHPKGGMKQIVVRENNLVSRDETNQVLHYLADTDHGSSGSPVCNNEWDPIALHHWGGPGLEFTGSDGRPLRRDINEGVRISAIVRALRTKVPRLEPIAGQVVSGLLALWDGVQRAGPVSPERSASYHDAGPARTDEPRLGPDGSLTWTFPVEISVRAPLANPPLRIPPPVVAVTTAAPAESHAERAGLDFSDRGGYEPGFIPGFVVPLPNFDSVPYKLAVNSEAVQGEDPHELRYHHFSIVMNADRKLVAVAACNIDGSRLWSINRRDKTAKKAKAPSDLDIESMGAESSDDFQADPRMAEDQMAVEYYSEQDVPGYAKPEFPGRDAPKKKRSAYAKAMMERTARMFQKGHIIMRGDPAWGGKNEALAAEADTFFYTNAAPQLGFFNQGSPVKSPGAKGKLRWRALETYILRNALTTKHRVCVFAGAVFADDDVDYRDGSKVPMRFWKIAVWAENDSLRSIAVIANQRPVLEKLTKGVPEGAERYDDEEELARVSEFLTTVAEIEALTKLDFGDDIRKADVRAGEERMSPAIDADPSSLARKRRVRRARPTAKKARSSRARKR